MAQECAFIDDGYTRKSKIKGVKGLYPDVTFTWRPTTILRNAEYLDFMNGAGSNTAIRERRAAECLTNQLVEWDLKDRQGQVRPINVDAVLALQQTLFVKMFRVVVSMLDTPDEELTDGQWQEAAFAANLEGQSLQEYLTKN